MHKVGVAIDAGHAALGEHGVRFTAGIALWPDRAGIVTLAAGSDGEKTRRMFEEANARFEACKRLLAS